MKKGAKITLIVAVSVFVVTQIIVDVILCLSTLSFWAYLGSL